MKLVSYLREEQDQVAILVNGRLYNAELIHPDLPQSMGVLLNYWEDCLPILQTGQIAIEQGTISSQKGIDPAQVQLLAPIPYPVSCRDGYAFRRHVEAARKNRHLSMIEEFDQFPVFYFTNHHGIRGPGAIACMPDHLQNLDFELEAAIVVCKHGRNVRAEHADEHIGGLMIMNDFSARTLQLEEMRLNLGPAKGKDFATALGPWLVTLDELEDFIIPPKPAHVGLCWNLAMQCWVNGQLVSQGNLGDMDWTFAEIIERASYGVDLYPGDIIGSGTVGSGCFLELNGTAKLSNPDSKEQWLTEGDVVEMQIDGLGRLINSVVLEEDEFSLLAKKKFL